jgi:hypothetical protein
MCLLASGTDPTWLWHARYDHFHFHALRELGCQDMVSGMPLLYRLEKVCDGCVLGKQHRQPFPQATGYRVEKNLELVHTDLCGPITPAMEGGNNYFPALLTNALGTCGWR